MNLLFVTLFLFVGFISTNSKSISGRINEGFAASAGQLTYQVYLDITLNNVTHVNGTGVILNQQWILTSASNLCNANSVEIRAGALTILTRDPNGISIVSKTFVIPKEHDCKTVEHVDPDFYKANIGLIKLDKPLTYNKFIQPIPLPKEPLSMNETKLIVSGWGNIKLGNLRPVQMSDVLQFAQMIAITKDRCRKNNSYAKNIVHDDLICTLGFPSKFINIATGDDGAPLVKFVDQKPILHGIGVLYPSNFLLYNSPTGFTSVYKYNSWIKSVTGIA